MSGRDDVPETASDDYLAERLMEIAVSKIITERGQAVIGEAAARLARTDGVPVAWQPADNGVVSPTVAELIERLKEGCLACEDREGRDLYDIYDADEVMAEAASYLAALQQRVKELEADARAMFPKEPYPAQPHATGCPGCICGLDARQAAAIAALEAQIEAIKNTNQQQYDEGYKHGLAFALLKRKAKAKALAKFVMTGDDAALSEGGTNVPENEEGQCAEWPRCACGRGGPDLCAALGDKP